MKDEFIKRQRAVCGMLREASAGALVAASAARLDSRGALRYLADYYVPVFEEYLVLDCAGRSVLFVHDQCGADYAERYGAADEVRVIPSDEYDSEPGRCVAEYINTLGAGTAAVAGGGFSHIFFSSLRRHLNAENVIDLSSGLSALMSVKSAAEAELAASAARLNDGAMSYYAKLLSEGRDCLTAVAEASRWACENGAEDLYWMASFGTAPRTAFLSEIWKRGSMAREEKYHYAVTEHSAKGGHFGEVTQLFSFGKPKSEYTRAFEYVCEALRAAAEKIRPGASVCELALASESVLIKAGYLSAEEAARLAPSIGHSQGYDIYETPRITRSERTVIKEGMRFNLHPSVRLDDGAVITYCDCYIAEKHGGRRLSSLPYKIIVI